MFDVAVRPRELLKWEIAPEFAIEAIPGDASASRVDGRARLVGEELRFAGDREKLPPGFANMGVWAHIDARVGIDEAGSGETETRVETEVRVRIAAVRWGRGRRIGASPARSWDILAVGGMIFKKLSSRFARKHKL